MNIILSLIFAGYIILRVLGPVNFDLPQEANPPETAPEPQIETQIETQPNETNEANPISLNQGGGESEEIEITAKSVLVVDKESSQVLFEKNSSEVLPVASLTKLMSALVFLEIGPEWEKPVIIQEEDEVEEGSRLKVEIGEKLKTKDLFYSMLIASHNNSVKALVRSARICCEKIFVQKMNAKAKDFGMTNTHFVDPTGLGPANTSTADDLAKLVSYAFENEEIRQAVTKREHVFTTLDEEPRTIKIRNTNDLLGSFLNGQDYQVVGGKTGYLDESGYCLALEVSYNNHNIIVVLLGAELKETRWQETKELVTWIFTNYQWE